MYVYYICVFNRKSWENHQKYPKIFWTLQDKICCKKQLLPLRRCGENGQTHKRKSHLFPCLWGPARGHLGMDKIPSPTGMVPEHQKKNIQETSLWDLHLHNLHHISGVMQLRKLLITWVISAKHTQSIIVHRHACLGPYLQPRETLVGAMFRLQNLLQHCVLRFLHILRPNKRI